MGVGKMRALMLLCCFLIGASGCTRWVVAGATAAGVGVGTYSYIKGNLKRNYEAPIDKLWEKTLTAVEELRLKPESKQYDAFGGIIKGKMADGKTFEIKLARMGEKSTEVGVRIGIFGDRRKSEAIHDKIAAKISG